MQEKLTEQPQEETKKKYNKEWILKQITLATLSLNSIKSDYIENELEILQQRRCFICDGHGHDGKICPTRSNVIAIVKPKSKASIAIHDSIKEARIAWQKHLNTTHRGDLSNLDRWKK